MHKLIVGLAALAAVLCAGPARADAPANVFDGAGVFVDNYGNYPGPWALADALERDHFTWVALHVHNGLTQLDVNEQWVKVLREHGLKVGAWGYEDRYTLIGAVLADLAIRRYDLDFYIADAEAPYTQTKKIRGWSRSRRFVSVFRRLQPTLPAALTTYGAAIAPWVLPIDFAAWRDGGFDLLPQAYYNQFPKIYRPDMTVAHAERAGWPLDRVHPVIGVYRKYPAANYVPLLEAAGTTGFSVWLGDQATAADYDALSVLTH
ncbi:MAG TPA: hypothetical protein VFA56_02470 [Gaiellaceae bacterium]|nr:hypothetical protein [Gaiellaceae bacterium]